MSTGDAAAFQGSSSTEQAARASAARRQHEPRLMELPNVVGISDATDPLSGTGHIVVYVALKVPVSSLDPRDVIPPEVDGVQVRVEEIGHLTAHRE